jgi:kanamycin kinase
MHHECRHRPRRPATLPGVPVAAPPPADIEVPNAITRLAAGRPLRPVWRNELGGLTFEVGGDDRVFVKWTPTGVPLDLAAEAARLRWVAPFSSVPPVVDLGADPEGSWLVTEPLPGESAVSERWRADPGPAVAAIGAGLRHLHGHAPIADCPFDWSVESRIAVAHRRIDAGIASPHHWHDLHRHLSLDAARRILADPPSPDTVVCHGDACAPNTIVTDDGACSGLVDLGTLGIGDRWADLAVATWSTEWNYGPGWEAPLLEAYGIEPDAERTAYYRLLWDLT